jgi:hypothetical protein
MCGRSGGLGREYGDRSARASPAVFPAHAAHQREHENRLRTPVFLITIFEGEAPFSIIYRDQGKEA